MAKCREEEGSNASSSAVCAGSGALICSREDFDILNQQLSLGSAAETLQRKGSVETFPCVGGTSWSGPSSCGTAGKVGVVTARVCSEGSAGSKLPVPFCS